MGVVRKDAYAAVFFLILQQSLVVQSSELEGFRVVSRPGRKLLQCTTEAACRARCPPGNNIIYLAPRDGTSGQCVCICSPTGSQQNTTPSTRSAGLIGSSLGGSGSFAQPLGNSGGGGGSAGNGGIGTGSQGAGSTNPDSGSAESASGGTVQSVGTGIAQQGSNLVGSVQSVGSGSSSETTTAALVNSATRGGTTSSSGGTTTSSSRTPSQSG